MQQALQEPLEPLALPVLQGRLVLLVLLVQWVQPGWLGLRGLQEQPGPA